ncbi:MAG: DUF192 domain-containing protein [Lentisphaeria bacterium]|nr:DUF192 domain-containing protein [Lentisphaeria bacterium]NQZ69109.1 DUF192 domain-containing protein [Lentisphaeria bacterium]
MIKNISKDTILAKEAWEAKRIFSRMRGMLARNFTEFDAIIFDNNSSIHMLFMHMPLDIIFLDKDDQVLALKVALKPWRMASKSGSKKVVELPAGTITSSKTDIGDRLEIAVDKTI